MWLNGTELDSTELDRGLQFGDGHFTTLTRENGALRWWSAHWQRLMTASKKLAIPLPNEDQVLACLAQIPEPDVVIKIIVTRGQGGRGYGFTDDGQPNWYVTTSPLAKRDPKPLVCDVADLILARSRFFAGLKTLNRLEQVMLTHERQQRALDELLVCDDDGHLIEATSSNIFMRVAGQWHTPLLDHAGIAGIVRHQLLTTKPLGVVHESRLHRENIAQVEQAFVTNSVLGLRPLAQIGEHKLPEQQLPRALSSWWQS